MREMISTTVSMLRSYEPQGLIQKACTGRSQVHGLASLHSKTTIPVSCHDAHVLSYAALKNRFAFTIPLEYFS